MNNETEKDKNQGAPGPLYPVNRDYEATPAQADGTRKHRSHDPHLSALHFLLHDRVRHGDVESRAGAERHLAAMAEHDGPTEQEVKAEEAARIEQEKQHAASLEKNRVALQATSAKETHEMLAKQKPADPKEK